MIKPRIMPLKGFPETTGKKLDLSAVSKFVSTGFFWGNDSYWEDVSWDELDFSKSIWHYKPETKSIEEWVDEFAEIFHSILAEECNGKNVILPLSGGLDSRTLAAGLRAVGLNAFSYSYKFKDSFEESSYGKKIAKVCGWEFQEYTIPPGYLWDKIDSFSKITRCYSEFTHPRQIAVVEEISEKGNLWLLGHWGDVLFDNLNLDPELSHESQLEILYKKVIKKSGFELGQDLYNHWGLKPDYNSMVRSSLDSMLSGISIENSNARIRAFKSLYWACRWTNTNMEYFRHYHPISAPYYSNELCEFIMRVPEKYLGNRLIQIEYLKKYAPDLAKITWQEKAPFNLYSAHKYKTSAHLPYRIINKSRRTFDIVLFNKKLIQRNWEIQFLGDSNKKHLESRLFENSKMNDLIDPKITTKYYKAFQDKNAVEYSHAVSMLLTLSQFTKNYGD